MSWLSGPCLDPTPATATTPPDLAEAIVDLAAAAYRHGRATERGDRPAADRANRAVILAANAILEAAGALPAWPDLPDQTGSQPVSESS